MDDLFVGHAVVFPEVILEFDDFWVVVGDVGVEDVLEDGGKAGGEIRSPRAEIRGYGCAVMGWVVGRVVRRRI